MSALPPEQPPMWPDLTHLLRGAGESMGHHLPR